MVKRTPHRLWAWIAASGVAGCTSIVGVDQDYELDPRFGHGGSALTGGAGAGTGGAAVGGSSGTAGRGAGGTGGTTGSDAGKDAGGSGGGTGGSDASAGAGGSGGSGGTGGGTGGVGGVGGASGTGGAGGVSGTGGAGGVSGAGGAGGVGGASGTGGGGTGGGTTGGASGAGTGGSGGAAGTGGAAGSSGDDGGGAAGTGGSAGSGGAGGSTTDAGDTSTGGSAGATSDASSDAPDTPPDLGSPCGPGTKFCGICVPTSDPNWGCAGAACTPCEPNGTATCSGGNCVVTGCNSGYHQVGNACVPNGPEVCNNNIDDDADTRTDCLDTDCLADPSCANKCIDATTIACDTIVTGQSSSGSGSTSRISSYSCAPGTYAGNEFAYRFTGGSGQRVFAEIYGLSGNLGLFQVGAATGQECLSSSCGAYGNAVTTAGAEALGFNTVPGQDYYLVVDGPVARNYSMSVQCTQIDGCQPVKPIEPGQSISATNNPASAASNVTASKVPTYFGPTFSIPESGPEAAWIFTPTVTANYRVTVNNLSQDCDAFVITGVDCAGTLLGPTTYSDNFGTGNEMVNFQGVANTTYYIVVDGYAGAICTFNISLTQL